MASCEARAIDVGRQAADERPRGSNSFTSPPMCDGVLRGVERLDRPDAALAGEHRAPEPLDADADRGDDADAGHDDCVDAAPCYG